MEFRGNQLRSHDEIDIEVDSEFASRTSGHTLLVIPFGTIKRCEDGRLRPTGQRFVSWA